MSDDPRSWVRIDLTSVSASYLWANPEAAGFFWRVVTLNARRPGSVSDDDKKGRFTHFVSRQKWRKLRDWLVSNEFLASVDGSLVPGPAVDFLLPTREQVMPNDWPARRRAVLERDGERCAYCGAEDGPFDIDHAVPHSRGGSHDLDNLVVACRSCNRSKGKLTPAEWLGSRAQ